MSNRSLPRPNTMSHTVAVSVADDRARARVLEAVRHLHHTHLLLPSGRPPTPTDVAPAHLVTYDLGPWTADAVEAVRRVRAERPGVPILVYRPAEPRARDLALQAALLSGVVDRVQRPGDPAEALDLAGYLERLLNDVPEILLATLLPALLDRRDPRVGNLIRAVLRRLARGGPKSPKVKDLAASVYLSTRSLDRLHYRWKLPHPKKFLQSLTLVYVALDAEWNRRTAAASARLAGLDDNAWSRLRRILPAEVRHDAANTRHLFHAALLGFATACRVPRATAEQAARRALGGEAGRHAAQPRHGVR